MKWLTPILVAAILTLAASEVCATDLERPPQMNWWTVAGVASTTYLVAQLQHEGLGHGGACLASGGRVLGISTSIAGCEGGHDRFVDAGGTIADALVAGGALTTLYLAPPDNGTAYYATWLLGSVSMLQVGGYMMVFPWLKEGDWSTQGVLRGAGFGGQLAVSLTGLGITAVAIPIMNDLLEPLLGGGETRKKRRWPMTLFSWALGSTLITSGALLNRTEGATGLVSAASATFAGTLALGYIPLFFTDDFFRFGAASGEPGKPIRFSVPWIVAGSLAAVTAIAILGPGIGEGFPEPHPLGLP